LGTGPAVAVAVIAGFFTGRGKPWPVMVVGVSGSIMNMGLNYLLIFGCWGFPELGVKGAAIATLISNLFSFSVFSLLLFNHTYEERYHILSRWRLNTFLFVRLLRFGLPNGLQFFMGYMGITVFILLVGRLGTLELAATNIAFNINVLAFMPMIGFGMAVMILVGQYQGKGRPDLSERCVYSGFHLTYIYMVGIAAAYVLVPDIFLWPFAVRADLTSFTPIMELTVVLLRFVAVYCLFDTMNIIYASGIKGAGDTRFVMLMMFAFFLFGLAIPTYVTLVVLDMGIYAAWTVLTLYIIILSFAFLLRFLGGKWKSMSVIEVKLVTTGDSAPVRHAAISKA
jgi:MATE family multidrug resistance protein